MIDTERTTPAPSSATPPVPVAEPTRWGSVEALGLRIGQERDYSVEFTTDNDLEYALSRAKDQQLTGAEGGYLLLRFDVDGEPYTRIHVDPPAGWWPSTSGSAPADLVRRGAAYLAALADKLEQIDALA